MNRLNTAYFATFLSENHRIAVLVEGIISAFVTKLGVYIWVNQVICYSIRQIS